MDELVPLRLSAEELLAYGEVPADYRKYWPVVFVENVAHWLHEELMHGDKAFVCHGCWCSLRDKRQPRLSIAAGKRFGNMPFLNDTVKQKALVGD